MTGVEVGVWAGENAAALLGAFPGLRLVMVDPYDAGLPNETMPCSHQEMLAAEAEAIHRTQGHAHRRHLLRMTSEAAVGHVDGPVDFVFIDANHTYAEVAADLRRWFPLVRNGGILSGHDYNGRMDNRGVSGVKRAVDEFAAEIGSQVHQERKNVWWIQKEQHP